MQQKVLPLVFLILTATICPSWAQEAASEPLTLSTAYALALKRSEQIAIAGAAIKEAEGQFLQSLSGALPKLSFSYSHRYRDGDNYPESRFTFSQPLFSGFKEFAAMAAAKAQGRQFQQQELRARQLLLVDVADAFYFYGFHQEHVKLTEAIIQALRDREEELKKRVDLGRSRASELASAQARLRRIEAEAELSRGETNVARELLEFLVGKPVKAIDDDLNVVPSTKSEEEMLSYAQGRADVQAAREAFVAAQKNVAVARAGWWPSLSLEGNSYTQRSTVQSATGVSGDWDATFKVSVPIFQGTETPGKVREAVALATQAELVLGETTRRARTEIRQAYARWESDTNRVNILEKAVAAAEENYQLQAADYRLNMVNNLDVLQALADLEDVRREYIDALTDMKRSYWNFKVKTGDLRDGAL